MSRRVIMLRLRWFTTAAAIGAITAVGVTAIMAGRNTITTAIVRADIEAHIGACVDAPAPFGVNGKRNETCDSIRGHYLRLDLGLCVGPTRPGSTRGAISGTD